MNQQQKKLISKYTQVSAEVEGNIFFNLMERVGSFGKYQVVTQIVWCTVTYMAGGLTLISPFLMFQDPYDCHGTLSDNHCKDYVCGLKPQSRKEYVPDPTMTSLPNTFGDYRCPSEMSELDLIQTFMFSGFAIGIFVLALLGGLVSKKTLILGNMFITIIGMVLMVMSSSVIMGGAGMFCCILGLNINLHACFPFITETVSQNYRSTYSMLLSVFDTFGGLANVLWFYLLRDFKLVILYCYLLPAVLVTGALIFFVKDTPICMITKSSPEKAHEGLYFIAKTNGKDAEFNLTIQELEEIQTTYNQVTSSSGSKTFSIIDVFRYKSLRWLMLTLMFLDCAVALQYYTPTFMLDQFKLNIFVNGLVVESSQLLASIGSCFMVYRFPRRIVAIVGFAIILVSAVVLIFIWDQNQQQVTDVSSNIIVLLLIFVIQFAITNQLNFFVVYINELFPTQVRIISLAVIKTCGGVILMVQSEIVSFSKNSGFKIMILFAILASLSIVCSYILPETFGKVPEDMIEELKGDEGGPQSGGLEDSK